MTTRSFLVNLLVEIVDEARLRIPIVRDIKLPGFSSLVMECFLPSTPSPVFSSSLSLFAQFISLRVSRSLSLSLSLPPRPSKSQVCDEETLGIHARATRPPRREIFKLGIWRARFGLAKGKKDLCPRRKGAKDYAGISVEKLCFDFPSVVPRAF